MKQKTWLISLLLTLALLVGSLGTTQAQSGEDFVWQYWLPQNVTGADDLKTALTQEVRDTIAAGHLAPFRVLYGELTAQYFWYQRFDGVYTLALAYPYLPADLQAQVKTYLKSEMSQYPLWSGDLLDANTGTRREADLLTAGEIGRIPTGYSRRPKLFGLYALWLYAQQTGDWPYIEQNWSAITSFYNANRGEVSQYYQSLAGAIGLARMAKQKPTPDAKMQATAVTDITNGLNAGKNFAQFGKNATTVYYWEDNGWSWTSTHVFEGFQFLNLTPEIARFINTDSALKTAVLGSSAKDTYSLKRGEYMFPLWYVAQGNGFNRYFGEGAGNPPDAKAMIFPLKAWVQKENAATLRLYVDVPDALIGDFYYLQGLVYTLQAHGKDCWEDLRTAAGECGTTIPTPNPLTLTPTTTPVPPTTAPTSTPTLTVTSTPTVTATPTQPPTTVPTIIPTTVPTSIPTTIPTGVPTNIPTTVPTGVPTNIPTTVPTGLPTVIPPTAAPNSTPTPVLDKPGVVIAVNTANSQPGQEVAVQIGVVNVTRLYGLQLVCQVDPAVLTGMGFTGGDGFNPNNSFFVDQGYQLASGAWNIAASRLRPAPAITGNLLAFTLNYQIKAAGNTAVTCTAKGVDEEGWTIDLTVTNGTYNNLPPTLVPTIVPTSTPIQPTPIPPTLIPNKMSEIVGFVQYPGRTDYSNIRVVLLLQNVPLAEVVTGSDGSYRFTDVPMGAYELALSAPYSLVIHQPVSIITDGQIIDQGVTILPMGDTDNNGKVDLVDAAFVGVNFEVESSLAPNADFNVDQIVNIQDLVEVGKNFGLVSPLETTTP